MMVELNEATFRLVVARGTVLVSWYRSGWPPWRAFAPIYQGAARRHPRVVFARIDVEREQALAKRCGVDAIPTLMAFHGGSFVFVRAGFEIAESLDALVHRLRHHHARHFSTSSGEFPDARHHPPRAR